ncbi:MAG: glutamate mutase L [Firmicutes bacterium]|nr:glutamate mutase L [Bacillota bacterium]
MEDGSKRLALLIDFGSTYTKASVVDEEQGSLEAHAEAPTTIQDITLGLQAVLAEIHAQCGAQLGQFGRRLACSSAAGGLRMVAVGLVPDLTAEAARMAALGAGAKVLQTFAYDLSPEEGQAIAELKPDLILLAGGTDGGNRDCILHNARLLAGLPLQAPVIVAGNRKVASRVADVLREGGKEARVTENVLPALGTLQIEPARQAIRQAFLERIVHAKGLDRAQSLVEQVVMPTPAAVLQAAELLAKGTDGIPGIGPFVLVDVGGATTDVYSLADGHPRQSGVVVHGLPEPFAKRTVEGDLGVRVSAQALLDAAGAGRISAETGLPQEEVPGFMQRLSAHPEWVPRSPAERSHDQGLAQVCVDLAVTRHAGRLEQVYTPMGASFIQHGKDLTGVEMVVGTGGPVIRAADPRAVLEKACYRPEEPLVLRPQAHRFLLDHDYVLAAAGLLAGVNPEAALRLMKQNLQEV